MLRFSSFDIVFQEIPDETTLAINLTGCPNRCMGCHSPHLQENGGELLTEEVLLQLLDGYGSMVTCVCFMGGDNEPSEVERLATLVHARSNLKVGWYSGKPELPPQISLRPFQFIKVGPFLEQYGPLNARTTNQRMFKVVGTQLSDVTNLFWC
jgi:anaerobic ribonucleoside-triphosphate reductase activating protein